MGLPHGPENSFSLLESSIEVGCQQYSERGLAARHARGGPRARHQTADGSNVVITITLVCYLLLSMSYEDIDNFALD